MHLLGDTFECLGCRFPVTLIVLAMLLVLSLRRRDAPAHFWYSAVYVAGLESIGWVHLSYRCRGLTATTSDAASFILLTLTTSALMLSIALAAGFLLSHLTGAPARRPPASVAAAVACVALNCVLLVRMFSGLPFAYSW